MCAGSERENMETNETILTKGVVSLDDRKLMGKVKGLVVDCGGCGVSHYIVSSSSTNTALVLPFDKSIAVGDTFMTIQSRADFLATTDLTARGALDDNFDLVGLDVYSRAGNHLGVVKGYDINTTFGSITKLELEGGEAFDREAFVFFAPEFVFVDDGTLTDADVRTSEVERDEDDDEDAASEEEPFQPETAVQEEDPAPAEPVADDADAELKEFLVGKKLNDFVASKDGAFEAEKGTVLDRELLDRAQQHDALLLLTMSVDD